LSTGFGDSVSLKSKNSTAWGLTETRAWHCAIAVRSDQSHPTEGEPTRFAVGITRHGVGTTWAPKLQSTLDGVDQVARIRAKGVRFVVHTHRVPPEGAG